MMLHRSKKPTQNRKHGISESTTPGYLYWPKWMVTHVARIFGLTEKSGEDIRPKRPSSCVEQSSLSTLSIVLSDTDNDIRSVENLLRFTGILNENGELTDNLQGITIIHTGDFIDKKNPDFSVVEYWQSFQQDVIANGCHVKFIVGNHEQEIWQKLRAGERYGKDANQIHRLKDFIESMDLFYVAGPVLFIHGYPTLEFLQTLLHFSEVTGKNLNCFNADHYKKAFRSISAIKQYSYVKEKRQPNYLLYNMADARRYYKKQGRTVGDVLARLKIGVVVHGHRPQRSGVQVDYEFGKWIPGVRMIGNDTMVKYNGIGATLIGGASEGDLEIVFVNQKTESDKLRKRIQKKISESLIS